MLSIFSRDQGPPVHSFTLQHLNCNVPMNGFNKANMNSKSV